MHAAGKMFFKTYLKAIRDTFFIPMCYIFIQQKGKVETFRLAGRQPVTFPSLSGTSWSPHGLAYCNDLLLKQKNYNM